ncbi:MAG: hypothetical protein QOG84_1781 [Sphingomonadales bacterium]|jgi:hypothetical protein|nr:hypothetical protein [Sphingomonadales bacterium]
MPVYAISYDLRNPGRNYEPLWGRLRDWKAQRVLESLWVIDTTSTAVTIRDDLKLYIDANDRVFVARLSGETAWNSLQPGGAAWLLARFSKGT